MEDGQQAPLRGQARRTYNGQTTAAHPAMEEFPILLIVVVIDKFHRWREKSAKWNEQSP
jgi:hypothetical protein